MTLIKVEPEKDTTTSGPVTKEWIGALLRQVLEKTEARTSVKIVCEVCPDGANWCSRGEAVVQSDGTVEINTCTEIDRMVQVSGWKLPSQTVPLTDEDGRLLCKCPECGKEFSKEKTATVPAKIWSYASSKDSERWEGAYATKEEAIEEGRQYFGEEPFVVAQGEYLDPADYVDAADIIERMAVNACDTSSVEDWPEASDEATAELDAFLVVWARKHWGQERWEVWSETAEVVE